jgi:hypothetical protein
MPTDDNRRRGGKKTGFIQRQRKITGAGFAQALVFGFLANPASSRAELNQAAATVGMTVSTPGLDKRFTPKAVVFLDELLQQALQEVVQTVPGAASLLARFAGGVWVADTSSITLPSALASVWTGTDGADTAGVKVAARWNVLYGQSYNCG